MESESRCRSSCIAISSLNRSLDETGLWIPAPFSLATNASALHTLRSDREEVWNPLDYAHPDCPFTRSRRPLSAECRSLNGGYSYLDFGQLRLIWLLDEDRTKARGSCKTRRVGRMGHGVQSHAQVMAKTTRHARWMDSGSRERDVGLARAESLGEGKKRAYV